MNDIYQVATGTIPGRRHVGSGNLLVGKNNQDAYGVASSDACFVGAVFDGCSSGAHSEVGAKIAAQILPKLLLAEAEACGLDPQFLVSRQMWDGVKNGLLRRLRDVAIALSADDTVILDHFLFTIVGLLITDRQTIVFSIGDGVFAVNDRFHRLGPFPDNAPPYLGYELLSSGGCKQDFVIHELMSPVVDSALVATDGLCDLLDRNSAEIPGWAFADAPKDTLTSWLRKLNSEVVRLTEDNGELHLKREYGLLNDDTAIVAIRRKWR